MKTNLLQAMINLQTLQTMTKPNSSAGLVSTETESIFQQLLAQAQSIQGQGQIIQSQTLVSSPSKDASTAPQEIQEVINSAAQKYGVDSKLITAIIQQESSFRANAVSKSGAMGLMQLMPGTARSLGVTDPFDITQNIEGGTKYISQLLDKYNGNTAVALAAYNAGPGNVDKHGGIPPFQETQNYVRKIINNYKA